MLRICLVALITMSLAACKSDEKTTDNTPTSTQMTNEEKLKALAPPPPECGLLTEDEIEAIIPVAVRFPMPGQRAVGSFYSCQLDVDGDNWSGQVIVDYPRDPRKRQGIIDEVAGATSADELAVNGNPARLMSDKSISVAGPKPYRVQFSAFPRKSASPVWTPEENREILIAMAEAAAE